MDIATFWAAFGSIATTAAVFVALFASVYPIWKERNHQKGIAKRVRTQLLLSLIPFSSSLETRMNGTFVSWQTTDTDHFYNFKSLLPEMHVLKEKEITSIKTIYLYMEIFNTKKQIFVYDAKKMHKELNKAFALFRDD